MATLEKANSRFLNLSFKNDTTFTILLTLGFLSLGLIGIIHHELWRDEFHAWMIARDSSSLSELFNNLRYEGHPALWHICLYALSRFTRNPIAMQLFHLAIAVGFVYLFVQFSPFTKLHKILFTFSYFPLYEYGIISRNYNLGVLLIFLFCVFFLTRYKSYLILSLILALLANTNAFTFIFAFGLATSLLFERIIEKNNNNLFNTNKWNLLLSVSLYLAGTILALIQLIPPSDSEFTGDEEQVFQPEQTKLINVTRIAKTVVRIWKVYVPIPNLFKYNFWDSNILTEGSGILKLLALLLAVSLVLISTAIFLKKPVSLFTYLSITFGTLLFNYIKFMGSLRHLGYLFIVLLVCFWLANYTKTISLSKSLEKIHLFFYRYKNQYLTVLLCTHVIAAMFALSLDLKYPFSASKEVTNFIQSHKLSDMLIVGSMDMNVSPIAGLLERQIYYPESNNFGTFVKWNQRKFVKTKELMEKTSQLMVEQKSSDALLIVSHKLNKGKAERPDLSISELFQSSPSIAYDETYYLYLIKRKYVGS